MGGLGSFPSTPPSPPHENILALLHARQGDNKDITEGNWRCVRQTKVRIASGASDSPQTSSTAPVKKENVYILERGFEFTYTEHGHIGCMERDI